VVEFTVPTIGGIAAFLVEKIVHILLNENLINDLKLNAVSISGSSIQYLNKLRKIGQPTYV